VRFDPRTLTGRGRTLVWAVLGGVAVAVAVAIAVVHGNSGTPSNAASAAVSPGLPGPDSRGGESTPVVVPETSRRFAFTYLSDLKPSGDLGEMVNPGPVRISGSMYPKSISFYCNVGDATAFPAYTLRQNARRFEATIGLADTSPSNFEAGIILVGDTRALKMFTVGVPKPKTVDIDVKGVHTLQLECFGSGNSATGGEAVGVVWGNARVAGARS
jgi:hypothetical protein